MLAGLATLTRSATPDQWQTQFNLGLSWAGQPEHFSKMPLLLQRNDGHFLKICVVD